MQRGCVNSPIIDRFVLFKSTNLHVVVLCKWNTELRNSQRNENRLLLKILIGSRKKAEKEKRELRKRDCESISRYFYTSLHTHSPSFLPSFLSLSLAFFLRHHLIFSFFPSLVIFLMIPFIFFSSLTFPIHFMLHFYGNWAHFPINFVVLLFAFLRSFYSSLHLAPTLHLRASPFLLHNAQHPIFNYFGGPVLFFDYEPHISWELLNFLSFGII